MRILMANLHWFLITSCWIAGSYLAFLRNGGKRGIRLSPPWDEQQPALSYGATLGFMLGWFLKIAEDHAIPYRQDPLRPLTQAESWFRVSAAFAFFVSLACLLLMIHAARKEKPCSPA